MNQLLFYLLQVIAASGLLYSYYHFALRNNRFHRYNRFYLLLAAVISIIIPFLNIPVYFTSAETESSLMLQTLQVISSPDFTGESGVVTTVAPNSQGLSITNFLYLVYFLACSFLLVRFLLSINKIRLLIKRHSIESFDDVKFVNTDEPGTPFSFFKWLFWNRKIDMHSEKGEQIFRHEVFHIQQRHSCDVIFMELLTTIFWMNPFFHFIKKETKAIHEFLADEFAVKENNNWQYAELLLMQVLNTNNQLVTPFFHNQIKRRIAMITSSSKPGQQYLRKLMVLPLAAIVILLFAFTYKSVSNELEKPANIQFSKTNPGFLPDTTKPKENYEKYLVVIDGVVQPKKGFKNIDTSLLRLPKSLSFKIYKDSSGLGKYGINGKDGVIEVSTLDESLITKEVRITPGTLTLTRTEKEVKTVSGYRIESDTTPLKKNIIIEKKKDQLQGIRINGYSVKKDNPLIVIDGRPDLELNKIETLDPNSIESIRVLKNKDAIDKYGEDAKDGVIEITTKNVEIKGVTIKDVEVVEEESDKKIETDALSKITLKDLKEVVVAGYKKPIGENTNERLATVYPNPADHTATILFHSTAIEKGEVRVYDAMANLRMVSKINFIKGENKVVLHTSSLNTGNYIINVIGAESKTTRTFKLIKK
jgi:beta-lactamase regulating signal transducer with metallopeptidase domain